MFDVLKQDPKQFEVKAAGFSEIVIMEPGQTVEL